MTRPFPLSAESESDPVADPAGYVTGFASDGFVRFGYVLHAAVSAVVLVAFFGVVLVAVATI